MIRTLTAVGFAFALAGAAQAQDNQVTVKLDGLSQNAVRSAIYTAAERVCISADGDAVSVDPDCFAKSYSDAMQKVQAATPRRPHD